MHLTGESCSLQASADAVQLVGMCDADTPLPRWVHLVTRIAICGSSYCKALFTI